MAAEDKNQIPWAKETAVMRIDRSSLGLTGVNLVHDDTKMSVDRWGGVDLTLDSRKLIQSHLTKSDVLTRSLRKYFKQKGGWFIETAIDWLVGEHIDEPMPWGDTKPGVLDWWPGKREIIRKRIGREGSYRSGRPSDVTESWVGSDFKFVHFVLPDGEEGLAVAWDERHDPHSNLTRVESKPEVWMGYIDEFFAANEENWDDPETYASYNRYFENGMLWALDLMDVFTKKHITRSYFGGEVHEREIPEWAIELISDNPDLLWPELLNKLLPELDTLPEKLDKAVRTWIERRRLEAEEVSGQQYFWPKGE